MKITQGDNFEEIRKKFEAKDFPVEGSLAMALWRWSNNPLIRIETARDTMQLLGYVPFAGYPLMRKAE